MKDTFQRMTNFILGFVQAAGTSLAWAAVLMAAAFATKSAEAQTYKVLYIFTGGADGGGPTNQLVRIGANLYGATGIGGASGDGVVFKLAANGQETVLHSFSGPDGNGPAGLVSDPSGNLYGSTQIGGTATCTGIIESNGCGVIFEITAAGEFSVLYSFAGAGGANPAGKLFRDTKGNFYGATYGGGTSPSCPGNVYQQGCGTIFKLTLSGAAWNETVLYNFAGGTDSFSPNGSLIASAGKLFGTTDSGNGLPCNPVCGTVFALTPGKNGWTETILHAFTGGSDGALPEAGLVRDAQGNLYGTTYYGGASGYGAIFKIDPQGNKTTLYSFDGTHGAYPTADLVRDSSGNFFGTATEGGSSKVGTVFKLDPANKLTVLHNFTGGASDGAYPYGTLLLAGGILYGTTVGGGPQNWGTVFQIGTKAPMQYDVSLFPGIGSNGTPQGQVTVDSAGVTTIQLNQGSSNTTYTVQFCSAPLQLYPSCLTVGSVTSNASGVVNSTVAFPSGSWAGDFDLVANGTVAYSTSFTEGIPSTYYTTLQLDSTVNGQGTWTQGGTEPPQDPLQSGSVNLTASGLIKIQLTGAEPSTPYVASQCPLSHGSDCYAVQTSSNITTNQNGDVTYTAPPGTNISEDIFYVDNNSTGFGFIGGFSIP
jgi:uncharacterized repeat protein (TIGR03803 family)